MVRDALGRFRRQRPVVATVDSGKVYFRRTSNRYARKGTLAHNPGFLAVRRNLENGRFVAAR